MPDDAHDKQLLHDLHAFQVERDVQNERLRRAQYDLEVSDARYRDLYAEAPVGFLTVGVQGKILMCNRRAADLLRLRVSTALGRRITEFMSAENAAAYAKHVAGLYRTKSPVTYELELRRADGRLFWAELTMNLARDSSEGTDLCRLAITDQTDRKRMQDETARLVAIVASSDQAIFSEDLGGTITSWNAGAEQLFGYPAAEAIGRNIVMLVPPDRAAEDEEIRSRVKRDETVADESTRIQRDGTAIPVFISAAPIFDASGRVVGVSQIVRDISEQVAARMEVARLLDSLRQADRRKDDFIATLAHELRNPLAPIRNAAALMRYIPGLNPKLQWCRDVIDRQVGHMAALLEDLLDVSRLTRDRITLRRDRVELGTAIAQAIEINRPMIESRGHTLTVQLAAQPIEVEGDLTRLTQIFGNLLNNAAKYTNPGGEIVVSSELKDSESVVRVRDNGIGIKPENLSTIFDLFSQVDPSHEGPEGGLGIGLALVRGLVDRHGGTIVAKSRGLDRGSEFIVMLPVAKVIHHETTAEHRIIDERTNGRSRRVLIADDNVDAAQSMAMILQDSHHDVRMVHDGLSALAVIDEYRPHLIVLDLGMPGMNGYEVARRVRQRLWGRDVMLVACTGWGQPEDRRRSHEAGFDHHLVKPVSSTELLHLIADVQVEES